MEDQKKSFENNAEKPLAALIFDKSCKGHDTGLGHPEQPRRVDAVDKGIQAAGNAEDWLLLGPRQIPEESLLRCHTKGYLQELSSDLNQVLPF